jgi:hypothetical protein
MPTIHTVTATTNSGMPVTRFGLTGIEQLKQNVMVIATMRKNMMVMDRSLGVDGTIIDKPATYARVLLPAALIEAIEDGEPRVQVISVDIADPSTDPSESGKIKAHIKFVERTDS